LIQFENRRSFIGLDQMESIASWHLAMMASFAARCLKGFG